MGLGPPGGPRQPVSHRVLVIGPSSGLAEEFVVGAPAGWTFEGVGRTGAVHAADRYEVEHIVEARDVGPLEYAVRANACDTVVSFLQEGNRTQCQEERPLPGELPGGTAWDVNVVATEAIGRAAVSEHKRLIVISTDEVFPERGGPVSESVRPLSWDENPSWYGGTWAEAETLLGRLKGSVAILRVSALFGWTLTPECDQRLGRELGSPREGAPGILQPSYVADVSRAVRHLVEKPLVGTFHVAVSEPIDRTEFGLLLRQTAGGREIPLELVPERHPGLVTGGLAELGFRPTAVRTALEAIRETVGP